MSPMVVSLVIMLAYLVGATIVGMGTVLLGGKLVKSAGMNVGKATTTAFIAALVCGIFYGINIKFLDKTTQPLLNTAFYIAVGIACMVSYTVIMKSLDVDPAKVPIVWGLYVAGLVACLFVVRTKGADLRESMGYYRGYEKYANLNLLDPPDAMETPEKAVNYYIEQYQKLRRANEDEGVGKILMTSTHWDAKWFSENYDYITKKQGESDPFGITKVVTSPSAHRVLALSQLATPLFGKVEKTHTADREAIVRMTSGQIVRLHKEGRNWKIRDWLGNRSYITEQIYEVKDKAGALTPEDEKLKADNFKTYENETKQLCQAAGIEYTEFDPYLDEDDFEEVDGKLVRAKGSGFRRLDTAKAGEFVDLSSDSKDDDEDEDEEADEEEMSPDVSAPSRDMASVLPPGADGSNQLFPGEGSASSFDSLPNTSMPGMSYEPTAQMTPAAPTPTPMILENVPVETLWSQYFNAVAKLQAGDVSGVKAFENCLSQDDVTWLQKNHTFMAELVTPGARYNTPEESKLVVLQAMLRNMPQNPKSKTFVTKKYGVAIAKISDPAPGGLSFSTALVQENGQWVLAHPFFTRDFVWVPLLATLKNGRSIPLSQDEQYFMSQGFAPFQQQVQTIYSSVGAKVAQAVN